MKLQIVQAGDPVLRKQARPLTRDEITSPSIKELIELMRETMREAPGVGLAAPQIGLSIQLAVIEDQPEYLAHHSSDELAELQRSAFAKRRDVSGGVYSAHSSLSFIVIAEFGKYLFNTSLAPEAKHVLTCC